MEIYRKLLSSIEHREAVAMVTFTGFTEGEGASRYSRQLGGRLLIWSDGSTFSPIDEWPSEFIQPVVQNALLALTDRVSRTFVSHIDGCAIEYFVEVYPPPLRLIVAGAGHVAKPVVQMGKILGFDITVICDRPQFANRDQFPWADEVVCKPYLDFFREAELRDAYVLLLTRGHRFDVIILRELLTRNITLPYIGMIGSRRRISGVLSQLAADFPKEKLENLYAPIGLDIGAQTPEEIAVSILGEIIKVKNNRTGKSLKETVRYFIKENGGSTID